MITKYFMATSMGDLEIKNVHSFEQAQEHVRNMFQETGSYLVMERRYEMKSERAITVNTD